MSETQSHTSSWTPHQPADRVLMSLKMRGPMSIAALAKIIDVTAEAIRQQMTRLHAEGLIEAQTQSAGRGRPTQIWHLTELGNKRFPDTHADVTVQMLGAVRQVFGEAGIEKLIDVREATMRASYQEAMTGARDLRARLERLVEVRSAEGYMAELREEGSDFLFIENHCPICSAARACMGFCRSELALFTDVLTPLATVERVEHILVGARRCAYRVTRKT